MERREECFRSPLLPPGRAAGKPCERLACELVDRAAVEVVDERVGVAVEGLRADRRGRIGDRVELVAHHLVERRTPEGVPAAVAGLEVRVDQPLRQRPPGAVDDRQGHLRCPAERASFLPEREELPERQPPRPVDGTELGEVTSGRDPEVETVAGQPSVRLPEDGKRARVVLPQELERRRGARRRGEDGLEHEPVSIGATRDVGRANFARTRLRRLTSR
jgi:hypothetical protein